jgi:hypothetical protein
MQRCVGPPARAGRRGALAGFSIDRNFACGRFRFNYFHFYGYDGRDVCCFANRELELRHDRQTGGLRTCRSS